MTNDTESKPYKCSSCGNPTDKITSGSPECWDCWNWRKMDGPAARHWAVAATIAVSNIDHWDATEFMPKKVGLTEEEFLTFVKVARKIADKSKEMLIEHGQSAEYVEKRIQKTYDSF